MWTLLKRILKSGFVNFWRNGFVSLASVLIMVVTLITVGAALFTGVLLNTSLAQLRDKVDINVYFLTSAPEEDIINLKTAIEQLPEVASVDYISREQALTDFLERHKDDALTIQAVEELDENPLGAILNIKAKQTSQYETIAQFLKSDSSLGTNGAQIIDKENYFDNKKAIEKLTDVIDGAERIGFMMSIILGLVSLIIVFNTIRLAIYTARDEISVMRLVGASNAYIRGPFVVEGIMYGIVAGIVTLIVFYPMTYWLGGITERFFGNINIFDYYVTNFGQMFLVLLGTGLVLGAISSYLAVRRYLKV